MKNGSNEDNLKTGVELERLRVLDWIRSEHLEYLATVLASTRHGKEARHDATVQVRLLKKLVQQAADRRQRPRIHHCLLPVLRAVQWKGRRQVKTLNDEPVHLSVDEVADLIGPGDADGYVHTFRNPGVNVLLGCDMDRETVLKLVKAHGAQVAGDMAQALQYGVVIVQEGVGPLFVATVKRHPSAVTADVQPGGLNQEGAQC